MCTHILCITSASLKSRKVLALLSLDLEKQEKGGLSASVVGYTLVFHSVSHSTKTT